MLHQERLRSNNQMYQTTKSCVGETVGTNKQ